MTATSRISSRHHVRSFFGDIDTIIELRDGAEAVDILTPFDLDAQVVIEKQGANHIMIACCGPAAPLPLDMRHGRCAAHQTPGCFTCWPIA